MSMSPETRALVEADLNDRAKPPLHLRKVTDLLNTTDDCSHPLGEAGITKRGVRPPQVGINSLTHAFTDENK